MKPRICTVSLAIIIGVVPLAVAGQHIGMGIAAVPLLYSFFVHRSTTLKSESWRWLRIPVVLSLLFLGANVVSTYLNHVTPPPSPGNFLISHLPWILLPILGLGVGTLSRQEWNVLVRVGLGVCMVFGLTAISQRIAPWQVVGSHFLAGTARARGFYSHPLTFAYAALALLPFAIEVAIEKRTSLGAWTAFAMVLVALVLSESRTVLLVAGMALVLATLFRAKGKVRLGLLAGGLVIGLGMFVVPSSLSEKVLATAKGDGFDRNSQFSDDRVAFWRVHWNLAQEKPILGHGIDLSKEYLTPYYEALGLHNFPKIYPAHNTFLQVLVNGGIVALVIFLAWFGWVIWFCWKRRRTHWGYSAIAQAYGYIAVASLTQNSFQDSEVRYLLTTAILLLVIGDGQQRRESLAAVKSIPA